MRTSVPRIPYTTSTFLEQVFSSLLLPSILYTRQPFPLLRRAFLLGGKFAQTAERLPPHLFSSPSFSPDCCDENGERVIDRFSLVEKLSNLRTLSSSTLNTAL